MNISSKHTFSLLLRDHVLCHDPRFTEIQSFAVPTYKKKKVTFGMDEVARLVGGFGVLFVMAVLVKTMIFAPVVDPVVAGASTPNSIPLLCVALLVVVLVASLAKMPPSAA